MKKAEISFMKSFFKKKGYLSGEVNGNWDENGRRAAYRYKREHGNLSDQALLEEIQCYGKGYEVKKEKGKRIIQYRQEDIVQTDIDYTYDRMSDNLTALKMRYPFLDIFSIGESVLGRQLYCVRLGTGEREVSYNGVHHAIEWITAPLLMKFIENFCKAYEGSGMLRGYPVRDIYQDCSIDIIPMVNPDGVDLVLNGLSPENPYYNDILRWNTSGLPVSAVWKANIKGVDLNRNYPAEWELSKEFQEEIGIFGPHYAGYGGEAPLSEPESAALAAFTRERDFQLVLAFHTQGEVIYWKFLDIETPEMRAIAKLFSQVTGYTLEETPYASSYAGYKDWFIQDFLRPGFTIEVGLGINPIPITQFDTIYEQTEELMLLAPLV